MTLAAVTIIELLSRTIFRFPTLTALLIVVASVAFAWGRRAGFASAGAVSLYGIYYYAPWTQFSTDAYEASLRLVALPLTAVVVAILIGNLRRAVHASEELLRRELEFRSAIDSSLGEGVYALDREGHVRYMNPAAEQLLGWTEAELRGKVMHDVIHFQHADGSPFPREACTGLNDVLRLGITHQTDEDSFTRKDGRIFPVAYSAAPIHHNDEVRGVVVAFRDTTDRKRVEEALRQREQWFRSLVQNAPGIITVIDANGIVLYQSPAIERVLGYKPEQLIGKSYFDTIPIHPDDRVRTEALLAEVLRSPGASVSTEVRLGQVDGSWRHIEAIATNLLHDPAVAGIVCNSRDITERKQAEHELRASRNQLDIILQGVADGITAQEPSGQMIYANNKAAQIAGYPSAQALIAASPGGVVEQFDFLDESGAYVPIDQLPGRQVLHGAPAAEAILCFRSKLTGDERWLAWKARPVCDAHGRVQLAINIYQDVTAYKQAEEALKTRAQQQAAVADLGRRALAIPDLSTLMDLIVTIVAETLRVEYSRISELLADEHVLLLRAGTGWKTGAVGHTTVEEGDASLAGYTLVSQGPVIVADLHHETRFQIPQLLREHGVVSSASVIIHGHDRPFGVLGVDTSRRRTFTDDDVHFLQAVANVLTAAIERSAFERQLMSERSTIERLAELDRVRTEFISSVSHDLRTPLTAARAGLGMLETSSAERLETAERQLLKNARRNVERLRSLIDDLLSLNQVDAGTLQLECEPLDFRTVVADAVVEVHALFREKEQALDLDLSDPLSIEGDARRLTRVLVNLLSNANQHTPANTHITISGWADGGEVRLAVCDTGPGIPPAELEAIFERFHRLDPLGKGSGLGLPIARGVVEKHGGRIWVESTLGVGTTFHIALPHAAKGAER